MIEKLKLKGTYLIDSIHVPSGRKIASVKCNTITNLFVGGFFKFLNYDTDTPAADFLNLTHIAVGEGTTPAMKTDVALVDEFFRKAVASKLYTAGQFTTRVSIAPGEGNPTGGVIREVGCFAKATDTLDSGLLCSRANVAVEKNDNIKLIITWVLEVI